MEQIRGDSGIGVMEQIRADSVIGVMEQIRADGVIGVMEQIRGDSGIGVKGWTTLTWQSCACQSRKVRLILLVLFLELSSLELTARGSCWK